MAGYNPYRRSGGSDKERLALFFKETDKLLCIALWFKIGRNQERAENFIRDIAEENDIDEEELTNTIKMVIENPFSIKDIKDPIDEVQMLAVMENTDVIKYIERPTDGTQFHVVSTKKDNMKFIKNPAEMAKDLYKELKRREN